MQWIDGGLVVGYVVGYGIGWKGNGYVWLLLLKILVFLFLQCYGCRLRGNEREYFGCFVVFV